MLGDCTLISRYMNDICIVGGGTAGWLSAAYLAKQLPHYKITLIESPDIPTIGVGEGTWPSIMKMFNDIGIPSTDLITKSGGGVKLGIKFIDFSSKPFWLSTDPDWENWGTELTSTIGNHNKCPILTKDSMHGCHFVATDLANILKEKSQQLGVKLIEATVSDVDVVDGFCKSVRLEDGTIIKSRWFLDATGFRRLIIGKTNSKFNDYSSELLVDSACVGQKNYTDPEKEFEPFTSSIGMTAGWRFKIPVYNRTGNGYVYSSKFISKEDAETEFTAESGVSNPRHIKMHPGYYEEIIKNNIVAVGFSSGFIEPLEATAIHIAGQTVKNAVEVMTKRQTQAQANADLNKKIKYIKVVVLGHYAFSERSEPFWQAASKAAQNSKDFQNFWKQLKYKYPTKEDSLDNGYPYFQWNELLRGFGKDHYYPTLTQGAKMQVYLANKSLPNHYRYITQLRDKNDRASKETMDNR
jgi:flavin-dependent dehydrogenase